MGGVIESQRKYCVQHPFTSGVHCNNLTNPSLVTEQGRYFGYIKHVRNLLQTSCVEVYVREGVCLREIGYFQTKNGSTNYFICFEVCGECVCFARDCIFSGERI